MFIRFFKRPSKRREQSPPTISDLVRRSRHDSIPTLEPLEPRLLLSGTHFIVDSLQDIVADDGRITLREAIEAANTNAVVFDAPAGSTNEVDLITFDQTALEVEAGAPATPETPLVFDLSDTELFITDSLEIRGLGRDIHSIYDPQTDYALNFTGENTVAVIEDLTVSGVQAEGTTLTANRVDLIDNWHGALVTGGTLILNDSTVANNTIGIYATDADIQVNDSRVEHNGLDSIYTTNINGAGIIVFNSFLTVRRSTIAYNLANTGAGIFHYGGQTTVIDSQLLSNISNDYGGAIRTQDGSFHLIQSTVASNFSKRGGGIHNVNTAITVTQSTITHNDAHSGGGIFNQNLNNQTGTITLHNSIVSQNTALHFPDIHGAFDNQGSLISVPVDFVTNPTYGEDEDWGTEDDTHGDLHLQSTSLAIDHGVNAVALDENGQSLTTDLAGLARVSNGQVDAGAHEYQGAPSVTFEASSTVVTSAADGYNLTDGLITLPEAIYYAPQLNTPITFAPELAGQTILLNGDALRPLESTTIDASAIGGITVDAQQLSRVLSVNAGANVILKNITLTRGYNLAGSYVGQAANGGGVYLDEATLTLIDSTVSHNRTASGSGGGIFVYHSDLTLINSTIFNNNTGHRYSDGGGVASWDGNLNIINSVIASNRANRYGGGVRNYDGQVTITNSHIIGNYAERTGGIYSEGGPLTLYNTSVVSNVTSSSSNPVGGVHGYDETPKLYNSIVTMNMQPNYSGPGSPDIFEGQYQAINSYVGNDPSFVRNPSPGLDGYWGTADDDLGDLRVRPGSPLYNAGHLGLVPKDLHDLDNDLDTDELIPFDLKGEARVFDAAVDIGAIESFPFTAGDIDVERPGLPDDVRSHDFGTVHGEQVGSVTFTLRNEGDGDLTVTDTITQTPYFTVTPENGAGATDDWVIPPGETFPFTVSFNAPIEASYTDTLDLISDSPFEPIYRINLTAAQTLPSVHYVVDSLLDSVAQDGLVTLREAILAANTNDFVNADVAPGSKSETDRITFAPALFNGGPATLNLENTLPYISGALDLIGPGQELLALTTNSNGHIFAIGGSGSPILLSDLTVTGGNSYEGGGINNYGGNLTINNVTISDNYALARGGGIYNRGALTLINTTVSGNTLSTRSSSSGGGIYNNNYTGMTLTLINSTVANNSASSGGGINNYAGTTNLINTSVYGNAAKRSIGGGVYNRGELHLTNSRVNNNIAVQSGGGLYQAYDRITTLNNSTVAGNSADRGGGIMSTGLLTINNSIVALNHATTAPDIYGTLTANNSLITTDPHFIRTPSPGPDGLWATEDDDFGDLRLQLTSPAVNTGDNTLLPADTHDLDTDSDTTEPLPFDLDNNQRIYNNTVDIGAYENIQLLPAHPGDFNGDESIDISDVDLLAIAINTNNPNPLFDLNTDQQTTPLDGLHLIQNILNTFPADFNLDYRVDVTDLSTWATGFGQTGALFSQGDSNFDGRIDVVDLSNWAISFGQTAPAPVLAPQQTQTPSALADDPSFLIQPTPNIKASNHLDSTQDQAGRWDNITSLITLESVQNSKSPYPALDIIKNITRII